MKFSEAMLKGFEKVNGRQAFNGQLLAKDGSVCINGAANLAYTGDATTWAEETLRACGAFADVWGEAPDLLNNNGLDWTEIYGMAVAAGL